MEGACRLLDNDDSQQLQNDTVASVDYCTSQESLLILRLGQWCGSALALVRDHQRLSDVEHGLNGVTAKYSLSRRRPVAGTQTTIHSHLIFRKRPP